MWNHHVILKDGGGLVNCGQTDGWIMDDSLLQELKEFSRWNFLKMFPFMVRWNWHGMTQHIWVLTYLLKLIQKLMQFKAKERRWAGDRRMSFPWLQTDGHAWKTCAERLKMKEQDKRVANLLKNCSDCRAAWNYSLTWWFGAVHAACRTEQREPAG